MIKLWSVSNFKSIREQVNLPFAPLTLFVGQNSAGKSTIIQSILLTAQTIQSNVISRSVVLNGRILKLGSFDDIKANNSSSGDVKIDFTIGKSEYQGEELNFDSRARFYYTPDLHQNFASVEASFSFSAGLIGELDKELQLQPRLEGARVCYRSVEDDSDSEFNLLRTSETRESILNQLEVTSDNVRIPNTVSLQYEVVTPIDQFESYTQGFRMPIGSVPVGVMLRHFLPMGIGACYDAVAEEVSALYELLLDSRSKRGFRNLTSNALSSIFSNTEIKGILIEACKEVSKDIPAFYQKKMVVELDELEINFGPDSLSKVHSSLGLQGKKALAIRLNNDERRIKQLIRGGKPRRNEISAFPVSDPIVFATEYITGYFTDRLKYLGPLRDEPKAIYPLAGYNDPKDIGFRGEFTAAVLDNNKTAVVKYIPSHSFPFSDSSKIQPVYGTLVGAVKDWLEYLGIAQSVATEDKGKLGHELTISTTPESNLHDLTHVGVGVSQALPIVVLSLLAESGSTLVFEQPELHLNPKVQTRLADFFVSLIFAGKQCVVETHSEYLVSRLRYLSATAKDVPVSKLVKLYFVEKPGHQSTYREVEINENGVIKDWPIGFFDETEQNAAAIIQAQIDRARATAKRSGGESA